MMYYIMTRRTQITLEDDQYRWLKQQARRDGSIAGVIRRLVDEARATRPPVGDDPFIRYLFDEPPARGKSPSSVTTIDEELYG